MLGSAMKYADVNCQQCSVWSRQWWKGAGEASRLRVPSGGQSLPLSMQQAVQIFWDIDLAQGMDSAGGCHQMAKPGHPKCNLLCRPRWTAQHHRGERAQVNSAVDTGRVWLFAVPHVAQGNLDSAAAHTEGRFMDRGRLSRGRAW